MTDVHLDHSHDSSWLASVDWLGLRDHLINTHGEGPDDIDDLVIRGWNGRRRHAEERHRALHLAPSPSSSG
jgi:hypothetical protein